MHCLIDEDPMVDDSCPKRRSWFSPNWGTVLKLAHVAKNPSKRDPPRLWSPRNQILDPFRQPQSLRNGLLGFLWVPSLPEGRRVQKRQYFPQHFHIQKLPSPRKCLIRGATPQSELQQPSDKMWIVAFRDDAVDYRWCLDHSRKIA